MTEEPRRPFRAGFIAALRRTLSGRAPAPPPHITIALSGTLRAGAILGVIFGACNIVFSWLYPLSDDTIAALLRFYGPMFAAWAFAAFRAARRDGRVGSGLATGAVIALATFFVFGLMNLLRVNLFLYDLTARADWQRMMAVFRASGFESLRTFILVEFVKELPLKLAVAAGIGAIVGLLGGSIAAADKRLT